MRKRVVACLPPVANVLDVPRHALRDLRAKGALNDGERSVHAGGHPAGGDHLALRYPARGSLPLHRGKQLADVGEELLVGGGWLAVQQAGGS